MTQERNEELFRRIAGRIRELRKARGLTQDAVYEDTGVQVKRIEVRNYNLTINTIRILCDYFGVTLEEFFRDIE